MTRVAVATTSQIAADAAAEVCEAGGNAVDCAVAAALLTMNSEPGVCALGGSAFVTVWPHRATPVTIDGNVAIPGIGLESRDVSSAVENIYMEYGGGVETLIGAATVAVPGSLAALEQAVRKFGATDWRVVVKPSVDATRSGFPLSAACHHYLEYSAEPIFSRSDDGYGALHDAEGQLLPPGAKIIIPHLADSLEAIGREGADIFYRGDIARAICDHIQNLGGCLTMEDMCQFQPLIRQAIQVRMNDWTIATNPPPAIGGAAVGQTDASCGRRQLAAV